MLERDKSKWTSEADTSLEGGDKMEKIALRVRMLFLLAMIIITAAFNLENALAGEPKLTKGQTVYVPVYSHIVIGERRIEFQLSVNLSIRNIDPKNPITILAADYYDSNGVVVRKFVTKPVTIKPMASKYFFITQSDKSGGWGANYLIKWKSATEVNEPIIVSVTYGARGTHSVSFVSRGKAIRE
jgi:hypothetical protein